MDDIRKVIAEMRERKVNHGKDTSPTLEAWASRLEAALPCADAEVDDAVNRIRGMRKLWQADLVGGAISTDRMCDILTAAVASAPPIGKPPEHIVLWSRGVEPNWYFIAEKSKRSGMPSANGQVLPVYETLDPIMLRSVSTPECPTLLKLADTLRAMQPPIGMQIGEGMRDALIAEIDQLTR